MKAKIHKACLLNALAHATIRHTQNIAAKEQPIKQTIAQMRALKPNQTQQRHATNLKPKSFSTDDLAEAATGLKPVRPGDQTMIQRQLGYEAQPFAVGPRCRHGAPQAFAWSPVNRYEMDNSRFVLESGLFRLSCPLLVKAIDEWEANGGVVELNEVVKSNPELEAKLCLANREHAKTRRALFGARAREYMRASESLNGKDEQRREMIDRVLESGIAGQSPNKIDVKCLHAHVADGLCRSSAEGVEPNPIAELVLDQLAKNGLDTQGDDVCYQQCTTCIPREEANFWYYSDKNRSRLRKRLMRRRQAKSRLVKENTC